MRFDSQLIKPWLDDGSYMEEFDQLEYQFINDDFEDGHDMFCRINAVDGNARNIHRKG